MTRTCGRVDSPNFNITNMRYITLSLLILLLFSACKNDAGPSQTSPNAKRYTIKGKVISVDKGARKATIEHEDIPGYMEGMTMEFPIHADMVWNELVPGAEIRGDLVVDNAGKDPFWIENVIISAPAKPGQADVPVNENFAQVGQEVPDFSLTNQDGKKISLKDFRGKALALTFIYAKCPLPDYCIRMSTNFSDIARDVEGNELGVYNNIKDKVRLLSISFDPANDTPEKLRAYGLSFMGKGATSLGIWQLAVGKDAEVRKIADFFGLEYKVDESDKTKINHSLRTAVIGPDGKVAKVFTGNEWKPAQLLKELEAASGPSQK